MTDKKDKKHWDPLNRGEYGSSPWGTSVFVGLRLLDGFVLQRALQVFDPMPLLFAKLGLDPSPPPPSGGAPLSFSAHHLTPFQSVIWAMSIGSALKHVVWMLVTSKEKMTMQNAIMISLFNTVSNTANTLAFSLAAANPTWSERLFYASIPVFVAGILIESVSEFQRKWFKDDLKNQGKPYSGGLFGYARSINYFGYMWWRAAFSAAAGGWVWGGLVGLFFWNSFVTSSIPALDDYCSKRYGAQWQQVKRKVPYAFCPGVY